MISLAPFSFFYSSSNSNVPVQWTSISDRKPITTLQGRVSASLWLQHWGTCCIVLKPKGQLSVENEKWNLLSAIIIELVWLLGWINNDSNIMKFNTFEHVILPSVKLYSAKVRFKIHINIDKQWDQLNEM